MRLSIGHAHFDETAVQVLAKRPGEVLNLLEHQDFEMAVPTPDHSFRFFYLAGFAENKGKTMSPLVRGYSMGSISMTCYGVDVDMT